MTFLPDWFIELILSSAVDKNTIFENASLGSQFSRNLREITEEHYDKIFSVNVKGVLFTVEKTLPAYGVKNHL